VDGQARGIPGPGRHVDQVSEVGIAMGLGAVATVRDSP
jgi:hypothetical protein